uniref:Uncharacterized protein LOC104217045 n=1 Tax=Nicotiana sylvestris TaxID=4096 RepID=A0A1U7VBW2_NICSY|nr:PREDICTED: uncharacterized protein LOC104217045 [Nicotiana sylvestris]
MNKQQKQKQEWKPKEQGNQCLTKDENQTSAGNNKKHNTQETTTEEDEGWQAAKGKSAKKNTQTASTRGVEVGNGFNVLNYSCSTTQSNMINKVDKGQCSHGGVEDRINGSSVQENEIKDFKEFLINTGICEMRTVGRDYTWTNSHVFSRIERAIVNAEWVNNMPQVGVVIMEALFSDHSPLCIKLGEEPKASKPFRFFNCLAEHKDFLPIVTEAWNKSSKARNMAGIWRKLKDVRRELKGLNTNEFQKFKEEKELKKQLVKWATIEESIYKQESRNQWLKLGDSNTAFFFASMKNRISHNKIRSLKTNDGEII